MQPTVNAPFSSIRWRSNLVVAVVFGLLFGYCFSMFELSVIGQRSRETLPNRLSSPVASDISQSWSIGLQQQQSTPAASGAQHTNIQYKGREGPHVCHQQSMNGLHLPNTGALVSPVVVVAYDRVQYLARAMLSLLSVWKQDPANKERFPLFVSVDGQVQRTLLFASAWKEAAGVQVITRVQNTTQCDDAGCNLTGHYKMLLQLFLDCLRSPRLLFLEEDLEIAPDFFEYFEATSPLLDKDPSLWCISAWNDHAQPGRALNSTALYRTDIIPGLGWMINRKHGLKVAAIWPHREWDEWMRRKDIRKDQQCIYPEMPRTHTFGKVGAHGGLYFDEFLAVMVMNDQLVEWSKQDLSYLQRDNYAVTMTSWLADAMKLDSKVNLTEFCSSEQSVKGLDAEDASDLVVTYDTLEGNGTSFVNYAQQLKPMMGGIVLGTAPKASYHGVVIVRCRSRRLFLSPVSRNTISNQHNHHY